MVGPNDTSANHYSLILTALPTSVNRMYTAILINMEFTSAREVSGLKATSLLASSTSTPGQARWLSWVWTALHQWLCHCEIPCQGRCTTSERIALNIPPKEFENFRKSVTIPQKDSLPGSCRKSPVTLSFPNGSRSFWGLMWHGCRVLASDSQGWFLKTVQVESSLKNRRLGCRLKVYEIYSGCVRLVISSLYDLWNSSYQDASCRRSNES